MAQDSITELTQQELKSALSYDPETGVFTRIFIRGGGNRRYLGEVVGGRDKDGYIVMRVNGKKYKAHRLAFLYMTGSFPKKLVDHIDRDPANNAWSNLREADDSDNARNRRMRSDNKSGYKGVHWNTKAQKWRATYMVRGRAITIGFYDCAKEANEHYIRETRRVFGEFFCQTT